MSRKSLLIVFFFVIVVVVEVVVFSFSRLPLSKLRFAA